MGWNSRRAEAGLRTSQDQRMCLQPPPLKGRETAASHLDYIIRHPARRPACKVILQRKYGITITFRDWPCGPAEGPARRGPRRPRWERPTRCGQAGRVCKLESDSHS